MSTTDTAPTAGAISKVAPVTAAFWVMKICATTLGETGGDLLSMTLNLGYAASSLILLACFVATLIAQMRARAFHPALYWLVIVSTSTAGTTMSDFMDRTLGLGYAVGASILAALLAAVLIAWRIAQKNLSVERIVGARAEGVYWTAILVSNTLGTALGDYLADDSGLGFGGSAALIAGALGLVVLARYFTRISGVILFWLAFVLTRPFGASFGDLLTKPTHLGGFDLGTWGSSAVLAAILVALLWRQRAARPSLEPAS